MSANPQLEKLEIAREGSRAMSPLIYVIDAPEHPFDLDATTRDMRCAVARVSISNWNNSLTPWPAPALRREDPPFGGGATQTLEALLQEMASFEQTSGSEPQSRAILGYSLGGLFALYALCTSGAFDAAASVSGSLWYDNWTDWLERCNSPATPQASSAFAFLSVGTKEKRAAQLRIKRVEECTRHTETLLRSKGVRTQLDIGPGSHFQRVNERLTCAFQSLDLQLTAGGLSPSC